MAKIKWVAVSLVCIASIAQAHAQSKDRVRALQDAVTDKQLFLRGFSADSVVRWSWDESSLTAEPPIAHIAGVFVADKVTLKGTKVEIHGLRYPLERKKDGALDLVTIHDAIEVQVDLKGADRATLLPELPELLFYSNEQSALDDLQTMHQKIPPAEGSILIPQARSDEKVCDCATIRGMKSPNCRASNVKAPKLIHQAVPEFTDEARRQGIANAIVVLHFKVSTDGLPEDVWIVRAAGMGLDESAAKSVLSYRFKAAMCDGEAVSVDLFVDVSFNHL